VIELTYDKQLEFLLAQVHGDLSFEDVQGFMTEVLSSEDIPSEVNTLWDATEMRFDKMDYDLQAKIVEMRKKYNLQRGNAKIAIVSDYELGEVMVKLFLILMEEISQEVKSFKTREEALLWFKQVH